MNALLQLTLAELAQKLRAREVSAVEALDASLEQINAAEGRINAYVRVLEGHARKAARDADAEIAAGKWRGPLHGVPIAVKDLYDVAGVPTTASSRQRTHWTPERDSAVVARLKAAGAVIVGKTQTHEFAYGAITPNSRNPGTPRASRADRAAVRQRAWPLAACSSPWEPTPAARSAFRLPFAEPRESSPRSAA